MSWADLMQCATVSERFLMIGDPGQIPPVVTIDVRRWETSPRAPHEAAPEVVLAEPALERDAVRRLASRLPAASARGGRFRQAVLRLRLRGIRRSRAPAASISPTAATAGRSLADGRPLVLTVPTPDHGPPIEVDHELASAAAAVVEELLAADADVRAASIRARRAPRATTSASPAATA